MDDFYVMLTPPPPQLSPSAFVKVCIYLILTRSLLPLVLHVTYKKGIQEPVFKLPGLFFPLNAFLNSIWFWCVFVCPTPLRNERGSIL